MKALLAAAALALSWSAPPAQAQTREQMHADALARAQACPAPATALPWLHAACELTPSSSSLGYRMAMVQSTWRAPRPPPSEALSAFWGYQPETTFMFRGTRYDGLPERMVDAFEMLELPPLDEDEFAWLSAGNASEADKATDIFMARLVVMLRARGRTLLLMNAEDEDLGIGYIVATFPYACRWHGVRLGQGLTMLLHPDARGDFTIAPEDEVRDQPRDCLKPVS